MRTSIEQDTRVETLRANLLAEMSKTVSDRHRQLDVLATPHNLAAEDQVAVLHEQFVAISTTGRSRQKRASIEAALDRLETGEFGICMECGEKISVKRMQAIPWASYCVRCQQRMEYVGAGT